MTEQRADWGKKLKKYFWYWLHLRPLTNLMSSLRMLQRCCRSAIPVTARLRTTRKSHRAALWAAPLSRNDSCKPLASDWSPSLEHQIQNANPLLTCLHFWTTPPAAAATAIARALPPSVTYSLSRSCGRLGFFTWKACMSSTTTGEWPQNSHTHSSIIYYIISTATVQHVLLIERIFSTVAILIDFLISTCKQLYVQIKIVNHRRFRPDYNG